MAEANTVIDDIINETEKVQATYIDKTRCRSRQYSTVIGEKD